MSSDDPKLNRPNSKPEFSSKTAHEYAEYIVDTVREPLLILNPDLTVRSANRSFYRAFQVRAEDAIGRRLYDLGNGQWNIPALRELLENILPTRNPFDDFEVDHDFEHIGRKTMLLNARRVEREGEPELILLAIEDITERKQAELQLKRSDRHKTEFLAILAHELRNPLGAIQNAIQLVESSDQGEASRYAHEVISRQTHHLSRMVDELLDASRVAQGKVELKKETLDLRDAVQQAVEVVRPQMAQKEHELLVQLPDHSIRIDADPTRLQQILTNLLTNSAKYTERGGRIFVSVSRSETRAAVKVRDNGIGISPDLFPGLFDLFSQAGDPGGRSETGLGVGLTMVKRLVELHGGEVAAVSELGLGSEFTISLPLHTPEIEKIPITQKDSLAGKTQMRNLETGFFDRDKTT